MKLLEEKIRRINIINRELESLNKMSGRLRYLQDYPEMEINCSGDIKVYDKDGNNPRSIDASHLLCFPSTMIEMIEDRVKSLQDEFDTLEEIFSVTEKLLKS